MSEVVREAGAGGPSLSRKRGTAVWMLIVVGIVLALVATLALWVKRVALETDEYVDTTTAVLTDSEVQAVLSTFIVDELYAHVNVERELRAALPPETKALAGPVAGALRQVAVQATNRALDSDAVQSYWERAMRRTHEQLLLLLDDESELFDKSGGAVFVDLRPVVIRVGDEVGIGKRLDARLPPDAGRIVILKSDQLEAAQRLTRVLRFVAYWFWAFAFACWAGAIWLAHGRRRQALRAIGIGVFLLGLLVLIVRRSGGNIIVDKLVENDTVKPAAADTWSIVTAGLSDIGETTVILGLVAFLGAWVAGPGRRMSGLRRWLAPYLRDRAEIVYAVVVSVFLLLIVWEPTSAFHRPLSLAAMAALTVIGLEALRRLTAREFPDAEPIPLAVAERLFARRAVTDAGQPTPPPDPQTARIERLERLADLRERGALSEEEYASEKTAVLSSR